MKVLELLASIARYNEQELPQKRGLLLAQLAVGYELLNLYRNEQALQPSSIATIYPHREEHLIAKSEKWNVNSSFFFKNICIFEK